MLRHKRWLASFVLLVATVIITIAPSALDLVPLQPCVLKQMPHMLNRTTGFLPPYGQYNFVGYYVLNSSTILSQSRVRGNVTLYGAMQYMQYTQQPPRIGILNEFDYIRESPEDLAKLTAKLANITDYGSCCTDPAYGNGYRIGFDFVSKDTTAYYFLFDPHFTKITVDIVWWECGTPWWRMPLVWAAATVLVTVVAFAYGRGRSRRY